MRELNREVKQHHRMLKSYRRIDLDKGLWPNSKRVYSTDLVVLEAPLAKTVGPEKIEIEWFHTANRQLRAGSVSRTKPDRSDTLDQESLGREDPGRVPDPDGRGRNWFERQVQGGTKTAPRTDAL